MAILKFNNVGIKAVASCVPSKVESNENLTYLIPAEDIRKTIDNVGIAERRYADADTCSSDLCFKAAQKLIEDNAIEPESIDLLIFLSQTPDYHQPATSPLLQYRLGLPKTCATLDVSLACSGYVYGLSMAFAYASIPGIRNVLLLVGETMSKTVSQKDKVSTPLFGDAGTATLVCKGDFGESVFSLNSDGSGTDVIKMPYGGYRQPSCAEGFVEHTDDDGNLRSGEQFFMDGMAVFNFGIKEEPRDIKKLLTECGLTVDEIDLLIYHQANKFMTDFFSKKLKVPQTKTPYCLYKYGNTSSASIPLTISSELHEGYPERAKTILSGFGAGLSWGSALVNLSLCNVSPVIEY